MLEPLVDRPVRFELDALARPAPRAGDHPSTKDVGSPITSTGRRPPGISSPPVCMCEEQVVPHGEGEPHRRRCLGRWAGRREGRNRSRRLAAQLPEEAVAERFEDALSRVSPDQAWMSRTVAGPNASRQRTTRRSRSGSSRSLACACGGRPPDPHVPLGGTWTNGMRCGGKSASAIRSSGGSTAREGRPSSRAPPRDAAGQPARAHRRSAPGSRHGRGPLLEHRLERRAQPAEVGGGRQVDRQPHREERTTSPHSTACVSSLRRKPVRRDQSPMYGAEESCPCMPARCAGSPRRHSGRPARAAIAARAWRG